MLILSQFTAQINDAYLYRNLSLDVDKPSIIHLKGKNGAGKSTLLRQIAQLIPQHGAQSYWDHKPLDASWQVTYIGHQLGLPCHWSVEQTLSFYQDCYYSYSEDVGLLLQSWQLNTSMHTRVDHLSRGMQQKLTLIRLSMAARPLLLLDEPGTALDSNGLEQLVYRLHEHKKKGGVVLLTAHQAYPGLCVDHVIELEQFAAPSGMSNEVMWS